MDYLTACRLLVQEVGVAGGTGPDTVENQSGALGRAVSFVATADTYIHDLWPDWNWKWVREETTLPEGESLVPIPADLTKPVDDYDLEGFRVKTPTDISWSKPVYLSWRDFDARFSDNVATGTKPAFWSIRPDHRIVVNIKVNSDLLVRYDYYHRPPQLQNNDDQIIIPTPRIVIVRAKMIYAEREDAPEVMLGSGAEYEDLMQRLEGRYLPGSAGGRFHEHDLRVELMSDYGVGVGQRHG